MRVLIAILVVSLSCTLAVAGEPPTKPKPAAKPALSTNSKTELAATGELIMKNKTTAKPAVSAKRQAELATTLAKRKAASQRKRDAVANQAARLAAVEASIGDTE